jgi:CheY-like chemotaxis protein
MNPITNRSLRFLVVEDWSMVADEIARLLRQLSITVIGPCPTLETGLEAATSEELDGALLDVNLDGVLSFPIADKLIERGIPVVFLTGYAATAIPDAYQHIPCLEKPFGRTEFVRLLEDLFGAQIGRT